MGKTEGNKTVQKIKEFLFVDLKKFINGLTDEQLNNPIRWWGDEKGGRITDAEILDENWCEDDVYLSPQSVIEEINKGNSPEDQQEINVILPAGSPMLRDDSEKIKKVATSPGKDEKEGKDKKRAFLIIYDFERTFAKIGQAGIVFSASSKAAETEFRDKTGIKSKWDKVEAIDINKLKGNYYYYAIKKDKE